MRTPLRRLAAAIALLLGIGAAPAVPAEPKNRATWVQTFESSPATYTVTLFPPREMVAKDPAAFLPSQLRGTIRYQFATTLGGRSFRVRLSNELGTEPLRIGGASLALAARDGDAVAATMRRLTFGGRQDVVIPAGVPLLSDPVDLDVPAGAELVATVRVDQDLTGSPLSGITMLHVDGDGVMAAHRADALPVKGRPIVTGLLVWRTDTPRVVVAFGDSITDGGRRDYGRPHGWADALARRLADAGAVTSVVSAGIGGNRMLRDGWGPAALARADRDVFAVPGVTDVILLEGINDIGMAGRSFVGEQPPLDRDALIAGYEQVAARAHARGLRAYIGTLLPFGGSAYATPANEATRIEVNAWIRRATVFDGVIDFEAAVRDPAAPDRMRGDYDSGDHLHPSDAGYRAMAAAVPLTPFRRWIGDLQARSKR